MYNRLRFIQPHIKFQANLKRFCLLGNVRQQTVKIMEQENDAPKTESPSEDRREIFATSGVVPVIVTKEKTVLPFDDVPGPKSLKYLSNIRQYLSNIGTQLTAGILTIGLNIGAYFNKGKSLKSLSTLFDDYGPVVRFISPVGADIVLINHPDHIQKVYSLEGDVPVRSTLDCLEKYRTEYRNHYYAGLYSVNGADWVRQRAAVYAPLHNAIARHMVSLNEICNNFAKKVSNIRNHQDEISNDLYKELHKWAFDCMGLQIFSKKFTMLETNLVYSQCDMSWLYHSLEKATDAIMKCESGLHLWRFLRTPAWHSLVKNCESLDNLIGKHVLETEQNLCYINKDDASNVNSLVHAILTSDEKMSAEDIATVVMDMLIIGVNTITSSMSFLLYYLAKYQRCQKVLHAEVCGVPNISKDNYKKILEETPYLQACIKETLRLVPPIPMLTRILPKSIILDRYNIPRGTLIIMSTKDASLKECNYDDAARFRPERWLTTDATENHAFASIPFGSGPRKCLGQTMAETMLTLLTMVIVKKYKLEYHYGDIQPTRSFIAKPNKSLKLRFVDRLEDLE